MTQNRSIEEEEQNTYVKKRTLRNALKSAALIPSRKIGESADAPSGDVSSANAWGISNMSRNVGDFSTKGPFGTLKRVLSTWATVNVILVLRNSH